jgi:hypothetical protein
MSRIQKLTANKISKEKLRELKTRSGLLSGAIIEIEIIDACEQACRKFCGEKCGMDKIQSDSQPEYRL